MKPWRTKSSATVEPEPASGAAPLVAEIEDVSVTYDAGDTPVHALSHINLTIAEGEFVSLIGPSGCGKTTLLRVVADLEPVTSGTVRVNGLSPRESRASRSYGYVFQAPALYPWRTALANVMLPLEIQGQRRAQREAIAHEQLRAVGLEGFESHYPWQLSGGMQQRVSIARALGFAPKILMMDEPFGALDEITRDRLNEQLLRLWEHQRRTVIFVTHSIAEAAFLSSRIVVMAARPGRIVADIPSHLPPDRTLDARESADFVELAHRIRVALREGRSYES
jgi:NitT/TauT family transport system ATP-binding protein